MLSGELLDYREKHVGDAFLEYRISNLNFEEICYYSVEYKCGSSEAGGLNR